MNQIVQKRSGYNLMNNPISNRKTNQLMVNHLMTRPFQLNLEKKDIHFHTINPRNNLISNLKTNQLMVNHLMTRPFQLNLEKKDIHFHPPVMNNLIAHKKMIKSCVHMRKILTKFKVMMMK